MSAAKFAIALAASFLVSVAVAAEKNCTQSTGYKYSVCGKGLKATQQLCCKAAETCIQVKPFAGIDKVVCSSERALTAKKAVNIVIVPLFFSLLDIALIAYLVLRCNIKEKEPTTMVAVVVLASAWPFLFSKYWTFGVYTMLLATIVACAAAPSVDCPKMPVWTYRLIWVLVVFQIIALFGPNEVFHVPLFQNSKTATNLRFINTMFSSDNSTTTIEQKDCSKHFGNYFDILAIEKQAKNVNPDIKYFSYCTKEWLATVQSFGVVQSVLWMGLALVSGRKLLSVDGANDVTPMKVTPVEDN